ncbi:MAG TPA: hypothetical protein VK894_12135 [Jiangellales bacterium]|nr:hypothetical protein [Jiangellales bacterium]
MGFTAALVLATVLACVGVVLLLGGAVASGAVLCVGSGALMAWGYRRSEGR